jgi:hypothetical protein
MRERHGGYGHATGTTSQLANSVTITYYIGEQGDCGARQLSFGAI